MAGEYAVASEFCRRNSYAQITLGNLKRTDILVFDPDTEQQLRVEVKSKQGREWPSVKGISDERSLLVFVDFQEKSKSERPDFYVLNSNDWRTVMKRYIKKPGFVGYVKLDKNNCPIASDGYIGAVVNPKMIAEYKERWEKLQSILNP